MPSWWSPEASSAWASSRIPRTSRACSIRRCSSCSRGRSAGGSPCSAGSSGPSSASRLPHVGGQYVYLARAYPPIVGFLYGVALLFIINGGSLAAVAILFASYVDRSFFPLGPAGVRAVAALALVILTVVNVVGVRAGKRTNNTLMVAKVGGILALLALVFTHGSGPASHLAGDGGMRRADVAQPAPHGARADPVLVWRLAELRLARGGDQGSGTKPGAREHHRRYRRDRALPVVEPGVPVGVHAARDCELAGARGRCRARGSRARRAHASSRCSS